MQTDLFSSTPNFFKETLARQNGFDLIIGIDEAGRGPLAGPVVAAAVILKADAIPSGLNDSKKLTEKKRESLFALIMESAEISVGIAEVAEIDVLNICNATKLAMHRAALPLIKDKANAFILVDGDFTPDLPCRAEAVIKGDASCLSIAAASIIAKVTRDRLMHALHLEFPHYQWHRNMGYGTSAHLEALQLHGACHHHRRSFAPIKMYEAA